MSEEKTKKSWVGWVWVLAIAIVLLLVVFWMVFSGGSSSPETLPNMVGGC